MGEQLPFKGRREVGRGGGGGGGEQQKRKKNPCKSPRQWLPPASASTKSSHISPAVIICAAIWTHVSRGIVPYKATARRLLQFQPSVQEEEVRLFSSPLRSSGITLRFFLSFLFASVALFFFCCVFCIVLFFEMALCLGATK